MSRYRLCWLSHRTKEHIKKILITLIRLIRLLLSLITFITNMNIESCHHVAQLIYRLVLSISSWLLSIWLLLLLIIIILWRVLFRLSLATVKHLHNFLTTKLIRTWLHVKLYFRRLLRSRGLRRCNRFNLFDLDLSFINILENIQSIIVRILILISVHKTPKIDLLFSLSISPVRSVDMRLISSFTDIKRVSHNMVSMLIEEPLNTHSDV